MFLRLFAAALAVPILYSSAAADIVVGPAGAGAPSTALGEAVLNAPDGERIFVLPGDYLAFDLNGKSLEIIGVGADEVRVLVPEFGPKVPGTRIHGLGAGQAVFVSGLTFDVFGLSEDTAACRAFDNHGRVGFQACVFEMTLGPSLRPLVVNNCADVLVDQCDVLGHSPLPQPFSLQFPAGDALEVTLSNARFHGGRIRGGDTVGPGLFFSSGGAAVRAINSVVTFHGTELVGGLSHDTTAPGGQAIEATNTDVVLSGPAGTLVAGGPAASTTKTFYPGSPAVQFTGDLSTLTRSLGLALEGGANSDGTQSAALAVGKGLDVPEAFQRPGLSLVPNRVAPGDAFDVVVDGQAGAAVIVGLALDWVPSYELPGIAGMADLDPADVDLLFTVVLAGSETVALAVQVPAQPSLAGIVGWFQSLQDGTAGGARLSLPTALVVGL